MKTKKEILGLIAEIEKKRDGGSYRLHLGDFTVRLDTLRWVLGEADDSMKEEAEAIQAEIEASARERNSMNTWEDTVMSHKQVDDIFCPVPRAKMPKHQALVTLNLPKQLPYLEAQAEITWKARDSEVAEARRQGQEEWVKELEKIKSRMGELNKKLDDREVDLLEARKAGIKEVVKSLSLKPIQLGHDIFLMAEIKKETWQAQLKEWGIKEE